MPTLSTASNNLLITLNKYYRLAKPDLEAYLLLKINALFRKGADVNAVAADGMSPIMYCVRYNHPITVIKCLVAAGANIFAKNNAGQTALDIATAVNNHSEMQAYLYSLYEAYVRANYPMYPAFTKRIQAKQQKINQAIIIHELVIAQEEIYSYGEYTHERYINRLWVCRPFNILYPQIPAKERIIDHLKLLLDVTNYYHEKKSVSKASPENVANTITRLSMHEFSLYTKNAPLSHSDFADIMTALVTHAKQCVPNVHLVASTFPVQLNDMLYNILVYIECGPEARLKIFTKANAALIDFTYPQSKKLSVLRKFNIRDNHDMVAATVSQHADRPLFFHDNVFISTTSGGAQFYNGIDICLDHARSHAAIQWQTQLNAILANKHDVLVPRQVSYMIVSNKLGGYEKDRCLTPDLVYAAEKNSGYPLAAALVNDIPGKALNALLKPYEVKYKYTAFSYDRSRTNIYLFNPPFGKSFEIKAYAGRQLPPASVLKDKLAVVNDYAALRKFMLLQPLDQADSRAKHSPIRTVGAFLGS